MTLSIEELRQRHIRILDLCCGSGNTAGAKAGTHWMLFLKAAG